MRGASRASFIMARERLTAALEGRSSAAKLGDELFAVAHLLDREPGLRRALTDVTSPAEARSGLARQLLGGGLVGVAGVWARRDRTARRTGHRGRGRGRRPAR
jgi:F-type H+-transporting ATPase subunit delta